MPQTLRKYVYNRKILGRWSFAVLTSSFCNGFIFASWMARLPTIKEAMGIDNGNLGILLFFATIGSFTAVTLSGVIVASVGSQRIIQVAATLVGLGTCCFGLSVVGGQFWTAALSLLIIGCGQGAWSVASNVEGASCEIARGKILMPKLHGSFSVGTLTGAVLSLLLDAAEVSVALHFMGVGVITIVTVVIISIYFKADAIERDTHAMMHGIHERAMEDPRSQVFDPIDPVEPVSGARDAVHSEASGQERHRKAKGIGTVLKAWKEPRTLALGFIVLGMALGEGAASDWIHISMVETYKVSETWRTAGYVIFVAFMAIGRLSGTRILQKYDRMFVIQAGAVIAIISILTFVFAPNIAPSGIALQISCLAIVCWALGVSLGFPIVMSIAAEDPKSAAVRVSVVSTIGYIAFLCGPPLLGFIADAITVRYALLFVLIFVVVTFVVSSKVKNQGRVRLPVESEKI